MSGPVQPRWWQTPAAILAAYTLLALALTWPLAANLTRAVPNDIGDPLLNTWILAWDAHALLTDPANLFNANSFAPLPGTLAYSEHLLGTALPALPLQFAAAEPLAAYNLSLLAALALSAFGMYFLALRWTHQRGAAFLAGLLFGFAPYRFAAVAHLQLLTFQWLPLALLSLDVWLAGQKPRRMAALFGLFLMLQLLASWYLAVYALLVTGLFLLAHLLTHKLSRLLKPALVILLALLLALPVIWPYLALLDDLQASRPLSQSVALAAHPADFAAAAPSNRLFGPLTESLRARPGFTEENTLFLGLVAPLLALAGFLTLVSQKTRRPVGPALAATLVISLLLTFAGPYAALARLFPPSAVVRVPPRWVIPALFALAGLAAFGAARLAQFRLAGRWLLPMFIFFSLCEVISIPLPLAPAQNRTQLNPVYFRLAALANAPTQMLVELPLHSAPAPEYPEVKRLVASTLGWWRLANGYSGYTPPRQPPLAAALSTFPDDSAVSALQTLHANSNAPALFLLVHPGETPLDRTRWETTDRARAWANPALLPLGVYAGDDLFTVLPDDPHRFSGPPLAAFGPAKNIRLLETRLHTIQQDDTPVRALLLTWQTDASLTTDFTVFVHLRAADGFVRSQADGPPASGTYPTSAWQPGQVVQDIRLLPPGENLSQTASIALGLYNPATGERLPAFDPNGARLPDDAWLMPLQ